MKMIYKYPDPRNMIVNALEREAYSPIQCMWLSFADANRPKGKQFLGVVITMAKGIAHAIHETHRKNINPGGECQAATLPAEYAHRFKPEDFDRLLSLQDLIDANYIDKPKHTVKE